jgi:hypothetical protein
VILAYAKPTYPEVRPTFLCGCLTVLGKSTDCGFVRQAVFRALRATSDDENPVVGRPILAAAGFFAGSGRLKGGCGQDCPPHKGLTGPFELPNPQLG